MLTTSHFGSVTRRYGFGPARPPERTERATRRARPAVVNTSTMRKDQAERPGIYELPLRLMLGALFVTAGVLLGGGGGDSGAAKPEPSGAADTTAPEVTITTPAPGSTVASPVTLV